MVSSIGSTGTNLHQSQMAVSSTPRKNSVAFKGIPDQAPAKKTSTTKKVIVGTIVAAAAYLATAAAVARAKAGSFKEVGKFLNPVNWFKKGTAEVTETAAKEGVKEGAGTAAKKGFKEHVQNFFSREKWVAWGKKKRETVSNWFTKPEPPKT